MKHTVKRLSILAVLLVLCTSIYADYFEIDGIRYSTTSSSTVEVTYSSEYSGDVVIPESVDYNGKTYSVTSIEGGAFYGCSSLESVTIGNSVTSIGKEAFSGCSNLASVTIGNSVTTIKGGAFSYCSNLASVTIPNSVTSIENSVFYGCSSLESVTIPNSVTSIENSVFQWCSHLASVTIPNSVTTIGGYAFENCSRLESVTIPNSVTTIGGKAFEGCSSLESVTIPNSVTSIGIGAFSGCSSLASVTIGNSVTTIGHDAFSGCSSLASVTIGNSVTTIRDDAFSGCSSLASVTIPNSVMSIGSSAFSGCSSLASVTIGNSVTSIGWGAFLSCSSLASVTILCPNVGSWFNSMTSIREVVLGDSVTTIGNGAFSGCSSLASVTIGNSVTTIEGYAFSGCSSLASVTIPNSVTSIGIGAIPYYTFIKILGEVPPKLYGESYYSGESTFLKIEVPKGSSFRYALADNWEKTDTIYSMDGNTRLYPIPIYKNMSVVAANGNSEGTEAPENEEVEVTSINNEYLPYSLIMKGNCEISDLIRNDGKYVFKVSSNHKKNTISCYSYPYRDISLSASGTLIDQIGIDNISSIECLKVSGDINGTDILTIRKMKNLKLLDLSDAHIVNGGMSYYENYTTSENTIGEYFFDGLIELQRIKFPKGIHTIKNRAFENCENLIAISVPNSVENIGFFWLYRIYNLQSLQIEDLDSWCRIKRDISFTGFYNSGLYPRYHLFLNDEELIDLVIPEGIQTLNRSVFAGCGWIESITLPASLTNISNEAFICCDRLTSVTSLNPIPPQIINEVFDDFTYNNAILYVPKGSKNLYWLHPYWEKFTHIEDFDVNESSISNTLIDEVRNGYIHNLNGTRVDSGALGKGIYIRNGKKVVIK